MITAFGVVTPSFMMLTCALERRDSRSILAFGLGRALSSLYGFLSGTWRFAIDRRDRGLPRTAHRPEVDPSFPRREG